MTAKYYSKKTVKQLNEASTLSNCHSRRLRSRSSRFCLRRHRHETKTKPCNRFLIFIVRPTISIIIFIGCCLSNTFSQKPAINNQKQLTGQDHVNGGGISLHQNQWLKRQTNDLYQTAIGLKGLKNHKDGLTMKFLIKHLDSQETP